MDAQGIDVSIVVISYNSKEFIAECLNSFLGRSSGLGSEIIVVDNGSQDASVEFVRENFPAVNIVALPGNRGYAKAVNLGIDSAKGRYIFILNSDAVFFSGSLRGTIGFMDSVPEAGIAGPQLLNIDGTVQLSCRSFPTYSAAFFNRYSLLTRLFPGSKFADKYLKTQWSHDAIRQVDWVSGAAMLIKKECLKDIGGFDEDFFMYCEDVDICQRAKERGWKVYYYPDLKIAHSIGASTRKEQARAVIWHHQSIWFYYKKHFKRHILWDPIIFLGIFVRAVYFLIIGRL